MAILNSGIVAPTGGYQIERSLRFNSADSAYLSRTFGSGGSQTTWTYSFWWKPCAIGASNPKLFDVGNGAYVNAQNDGTLFIEAVGGELGTSQVFRDFSAWYHIVITANSTNATSSDRLRLYVNGVRVTAFGTNTQPSLNATSIWNSAVEHNISRRIAAPSNSYLNAYLTEINFIDGQALTPSSFGETNPTTGVWQPKEYTGTYGTNGFYLNFSDNSGTTSTTLGKDSSGNGNNWTPNNFSVTAGAGNDSLVDTPTNYGTDTGAGGEVRGNYATLNPLDYASGITFSNGNLQGSRNAVGTAAYGARAGIALPITGKWYWEIRPTYTTTVVFGIANESYSLNTDVTWAAAQSVNAWAFAPNSGNKHGNGAVSAYGTSVASNSTIGVAWDADNQALYFTNGSGTWQNSGDPTSGALKTGAAFTSGFSGTLFPLISPWSGDSAALNFGQRPFAYTAPSGFKALCTQNLPTPTIGATSTTQADDYFDAVLWSGDSSLSRNITGWDFNLDFLWVKQRNSARDHWLVDRVRGVQKGVVSNSTAAESTDATATNAFVDGSGADASGFTAGNGSAVWAGVNGSGNTYVGWGWKANGAGSSNTAGTITSTVSANTDSGFSIVTYAGNSTAAATVGHGLGVTPSMVIIKNRTGAYGWVTRHISLSATQNVALQTTDAAYTVSTQTSHGGVGTLTSTTFSFISGTVDLLNANQTSNNYVAYCFAAVPGYSAALSWTGNGNSDGVFVYCGFKPRMLLVKRTDTTGSWIIWDTARNTYNVVNNRLYPNTSGAEDGSTNDIDILSNGFKARNTGGEYNASGGTYIGFAWAEVPFRYALAR